MSHVFLKSPKLESCLITCRRTGPQFLSRLVHEFAHLHPVGNASPEMRAGRFRPRRCMPREFIRVRWCFKRNHRCCSASIIRTGAQPPFCAMCPQRPHDARQAGAQNRLLPLQYRHVETWRTYAL